MRTKEKENGRENETRTRSYAIAGTIAIAFALIAALMVMPATAFEPGECDIYVHDGQSIDAAVDSATDGQTVCVYNGTYGGFIEIDTPNVTLKGEGADVVTWDGGSEHQIVFGTYDASGCILEGFTIKGTKAGADLVISLAPDCIIRNCVFEGLTFQQGIQISAKNTTFENNVVLNAAGSINALTVSKDAESSTIINNSIIGNIFPGAYPGAVCLYARNCTIANNTITNNTGAAMILAYYTGYYNAENYTITRNTISGNTKQRYLAMV